MFYSHEVLTSREHGVATVWLVATLGSKSNLKKVSRKAILDVNVQKACETIVTPHAPMALRLQSNLLYGVTRVYAQQCGYVLNDAEAAKNHMRLMFKIMNASVLDAEGGNQARADQLMLQDDPNFFPDLDLVPHDLDRMDLDLTTTGGSQGSTLSPHNSQLAGTGTGSPEDIGGLIIPSASSLYGGPVGGIGGFSVRGDCGAGSRVERPSFLDDDLGLLIDEDGNLQITDAPPRQPRLPLTRGESTGLGAGGSDIGFQAAGGEEEQNIFGQQDDDMYMPLQDDFMILPDDREMFQAGPAAAVKQHITSEETVAPLRQKARTALRSIPLDAITVLHNRDLARWNVEYITTMQDTIRQKEAAKAAALAKKNAEIWVLGPRDEGPLSIFSGSKLLERFAGVKSGHAGVKRPRDDGDGSDTDRRVRSRGEPSSDDVGRAIEDDAFMPMMDDTIEMGREAPTPLDDRHVSSIMPWNQSAGSQRRTGLYSGQNFPTSASLGGAGGQLGLLAGRGSRLTSASPLMGRGTAPGNGNDFQLPGSQGELGLEGLDEFELFGPAAGVDTQTAGLSQWQRTILDGESMHFLEFVETGIQEMDESREQATQGDESDLALQGSIDFEILLPPESHSCVVAAQGLLHVLALGTKNLLTVEQDEPYGPITLRAVPSA